MVIIAFKMFHSVSLTARSYASVVIPISHLVFNLIVRSSSSNKNFLELPPAARFLAYPPIVGTSHEKWPLSSSSCRCDFTASFIPSPREFISGDRVDHVLVLTHTFRLHEHLVARSTFREAFDSFRIRNRELQTGKKWKRKKKKVEIQRKCWMEFMWSWRLCEAVR